MVHPDLQYLEGDDGDPRGKLLPVYPLTEGVRQGQMRRIVGSVVDSLAEHLDEVLPARISRHA